MFVFRYYIYFGVKEGFVEFDLMEYDFVFVLLFWSRILGVLRYVFGIEVDLEKVWEQYVVFEFEMKNVVVIMVMMVLELYVNYVLIFIGGIGQKDLYVFY